MAGASSLVLPETGLLRAGDPRFRTPLNVIGKRLLVNGFLKHVDADDFGQQSNALLLCTFRAPEPCNNVFGQSNHVGLPSERIDPKIGALWGCLSQIYLQVGLILSAMRLSRTPEERLWHAS